MKSRPKILSSSEDSSSSDDSSGSGSSDEDDDVVPSPSGKTAEKFKIPKIAKVGPWSSSELENFKKNWPHLRNFEDSVLKHASLKELAGIGKTKMSHSKVASSRMAQNYEQLVNFPVIVEAGSDDCIGQVHSARFLRGYVGEAQELWIQARNVIGIDGLDPISNYELVSTGVGDLLTPKVWEEIHKPGSRLLALAMLSTKSVEAAWRFPDKLEAPKSFESIQELKLAVATLDTAVHRVMPWNMSFRTLFLFLISNDFGAWDLAGKPARVSLLTGFVDEILRANARNWEEKKKYVSHQELCIKWAAFMNRNQVLLKAGEPGSKRKAEMSGSEDKKPRIPKWVCKKFNQGDCEEKTDKHSSFWDPNFILKHVCSKIGPEGRCCLQAHARKDHK